MSQPSRVATRENARAVFGLREDDGDRRPALPEGGSLRDVQPDALGPVPVKIQGQPPQ